MNQTLFLQFEPLSIILTYDRNSFTVYYYFLFRILDEFFMFEKLALILKSLEESSSNLTVFHSMCKIYLFVPLPIFQL